MLSPAGRGSVYGVVMLYLDDPGNVVLYLHGFIEATPIWEEAILD